jgi:hypothetical protein
MADDIGRSPDGSGHSAKPEPISVVSAQGASAPSAAGLYIYATMVSRHEPGTIITSMVQGYRFAQSEDEARGMAVAFTTAAKPGFGIDQVLVLRVGDEHVAHARPEGLREALDDLQQAEFEYRLMHDRHGEGASATGRAWDLMKRAGDKARAALVPQSPAPSADGELVERVAREDAKLIAYLRRQGGQCNRQQPIVPVAGSELLKAADRIEALTATAPPTDADEDSLVMLMLNELHSNMPEIDRPMSFSDLSDEQAERARKAIRAVVVAAGMSKPAGRWRSMADLEAHLACDADTKGGDA